jgi:hypothetical protein
VLTNEELAEIAASPWLTADELFTDEPIVGTDPDQCTYLIQGHLDSDTVDRILADLNRSLLSGAIGDPVERVTDSLRHVWVLVKPDLDDPDDEHLHVVEVDHPTHGAHPVTIPDLWYTD